MIYPPRAKSGQSGRARRVRGDLQTPMTAMIDVVFLLLVFFVWTSSFQVEEQLLPSSMAATAGIGDAPKLDVPAELETVVVRIEDNAGDESSRIWSVNGQRFGSFDQFLVLLRSVASIGTDVPLIVDPQPTIPLHAVVRTYDAARSVGFQRVHFAVDSESW